MSLTKQSLESQPAWQPVAVNLEAVRREVNHARRTLDGIENLSELDFDGIAAMLRSLARAESLLAETQGQLEQAYY